MSLSRYEEIFLRLAAAEIAAKFETSGAVGVSHSIQYYSNAATKIEEHFEERALRERQNIARALQDLPALLKRQAE